MPLQNYLYPAGASTMFVVVNFEEPGEPLGMLADAIDEKTGELLSIEVGFDPTDAAMLTALRTERESGAAVSEVGQRYKDATHNTEFSRVFLRQETEAAVQHLAESSQVRLLKVEVKMPTRADYGEIAVHYRNIAAGEDQTVTLSFPKAA